jgi:uncharacterized protein
MVNEPYINVEVVYASEALQQIRTVCLRAGSTVMEAIEASQLLMVFPEIDLAQQKVGIFSQLVDLTSPVSDGDRIEIYRALKVDPKDARRLRAKG